MTVHRALEKGHCDVVDFFFKNDAALATKRYRDGRNALTIAAAAGQPAVIDLLVRKYGMQPYDMDALCAAARHDRPSSLRKLASLIQSSSLIQDSSLPQASLPQASLPQASLPQASLPQASLPQASLPQASLPQVNQWMETPDREGETPIVAAMRNGAYVSMLALAEMGCQPFDVLFEMARLNKTAALVELLAVIIDKQGRMQDVVDARHTSEDGVSHTLLSWAAAHGSFNCALEVMRRVDALKKMHV
jgi:ankyrin repeat protein